MYVVSCAVVRAQGLYVMCMMFIVHCPCARTWCYVYAVSHAVVRARGPGVACEPNADGAVLADEQPAAATRRPRKLHKDPR